MRRTIITAGIALAAALTLAPVAPTVADEGVGADDATNSTAVVVGEDDAEKLALASPAAAEQEADQALAVATRVLEGEAKTKDPDPTIALLQLSKALPDLDATERREARRLLARPTNGDNDRFGDGYNSPSFRKCNARLCVHYITNEADVDDPPDGWATETLKQLNKVWTLEVVNMHYRKPLSDRGKGGDNRFDVYLVDIGSDGLYGYCATERGSGYSKPGYCVLDNDFAVSQFGGVPLDTLKVTAAHEFFHAIQFGYDAAEDLWFMESTATWMEERFADSVDDNRQYLPAGQLGVPARSLDAFIDGAGPQYGNWVWWEYLSHRYNSGIVRTIWSKAAAYAGAPDYYSTQAVASALASRGGFTSHFGTYASLNTAPGSWYPEGASWPAAPMSASHTPTSTTPVVGAPLSVSHMASRNVRVFPGGGSQDFARLRIRVDGPPKRTAPTAVVLVTDDDGSRTRTTISLTEVGGTTRGTVVVPFDQATVQSVTLTLANASTRFDCWEFTEASCRGIPRDESKTFGYTLTALQG